jgi:hypothetical protein
MKAAFLFVPGIVALIAVGCSSSSTTTPQTPKDGGTTGTGTDGGGGGGGTDSGGGDMTMDAGGGTTDAGGGGPVIELGDGGCVTYQSASMLCGTMSDDSVCKFSVGCGHSTDDGQCKINCEMGSTVNCFTADDAKCLEDAVKSGSCTDLKNCKWIL